MDEWNPDYLPPDRRKHAQDAARKLRAAMIGHRVGVELRAALVSLQEALRTAGVVLAVLLVVGVHQAPVWLICALFFAPLLSNGAVLALATLLAFRRPRVRSDDEA